MGFLLGFIIGSLFGVFTLAFIIGSDNPYDD